MPLSIHGTLLSHNSGHFLNLGRGFFPTRKSTPLEVRALSLVQVDLYSNVESQAYTRCL